MSNSQITSNAICATCRQPGHRRVTSLLCPRNPRNIVSSSSNVPRNIETHSSEIPEETSGNEINALEAIVAASIDFSEPFCICGSDTHSSVTDRECPYNLLTSPNTNGRNYNIARQILSLPSRQSLGSMDRRCINCSALMWIKEKSAGGNSNPRFQICCGNGQYVLSPFTPTPVYIKHLLQRDDEECKEFKRNIRGYNNALSFTSLGVNLDTSVHNSNGGAFCFRIHGSLYHRIGSVLPGANQTPKFAQIYIYDGTEEQQLDARLNHMNHLYRPTLSMLQSLMHSLPNPFVTLFKTMKHYIDTNPDMVSNMKFVIKADRTPDPRRYNDQYVNEVAVLIVDCGESDGRSHSNRDIVLRPLNGGELLSITEIHLNYDPLSYPLMFPKGDNGWSISTTSLTNKKVTTMRYYSHRLMYRNDDHSLHLYGNLFHQYIVDQYAKIEHERLKYLKLNQDKLRVELYRGLQDAVTNNDTDIATIGRRFILPSSFIGGPRHMAQLYQDAISIVRKFGKPDLFVTFTCNPNWPEINDALLFDQSAGDRPDLCARVFHQMLQCLMDDLIKKLVLGKVMDM